MKVHVPPAYNLRGRRQVWFVETGNDRIDDPINGFLLAMTVLGPISLVVNSPL